MASWLATGLLASALTGSISIGLGSIRHLTPKEDPPAAPEQQAASPADANLRDSATPRVVHPVYVIRQPRWTATTDEPADADAQPAATVEMYAWVTNLDRLDNEPPRFQHRTVVNGAVAGGDRRDGEWELSVSDLEPVTLPPVHDPAAGAPPATGVWR